MTNDQRTPTPFAALLAASFDAAALVARTQSPTTFVGTGTATDALRRITKSTTLRGPRRISLAGSR